MLCALVEIYWDALIDSRFIAKRQISIVSSNPDAQHDVDNMQLIHISGKQRPSTPEITNWFAILSTVGTVVIQYPLSCIFSSPPCHEYASANWYFNNRVMLLKEPCKKHKTVLPYFILHMTWFDHEAWPSWRASRIKLRKMQCTTPLTATLKPSRYAYLTFYLSGSISHGFNHGSITHDDTWLFTHRGLSCGITILEAFRLEWVALSDQEPPLLWKQC